MLGELQKTAEITEKYRFLSLHHGRVRASETRRISIIWLTHKSGSNQLLNIHKSGITTQSTLDTA